jgi:hypothetical protein
MKSVFRYIFSFAVVVNVHAFLLGVALFANFMELYSVASTCEALISHAFQAKVITDMHPSLGSGVFFVSILLVMHLLWAAIIAAVWRQLKNKKSQNKKVEHISHSSRCGKMLT